MENSDSLILETMHHDWREHIIELIQIFHDQVDNATDNHNDNAIFTEEDAKIMVTVADLLGVETEKLTQVSEIIKLY